MKNLFCKYFDCNDLIQCFGEKKLEERFDSTLSMMETYISKNGLEEQVYVDRLVLANVIIDYFSDIERLKSFHTDIKKVNSEKVISYMSCWILRRKPIQIKNHTNSQYNKDLVTINERFVLQYILNYLSERKVEKHILLRDNTGLKNFASLFLYYLVYRKFDAQSLEMILTAFMAGQIYENTVKDISTELHPFDILEDEYK